MTNATSSISSVDLPAAGTYRLDTSRSSITFRMRHLFGLATATGTMKITSGEIVIYPVLPQVRVRVAVDAASFETGTAKRDSDVRGPKFLDAKQHPELTFRATDLVETGGGRALNGELTVRGVSAPVTLTITSAELTGRGFRAQASTRIDRYALGVTAGKGMAGRFLDLELTVQAESIG